MQASTLSFIILSFFLIFSLQLNAQVEIKMNHVGTLLDYYTGVFEIPVSHNFGLETELIIVANKYEKGGGVILHGKYYFDPDFGLDKFYVGIFSGGFGTEEVIAGFGFEGGYKWVGERNVIFELGVGAARITSENDGVPYGRIMIGYRFSKRRK